MDNFSDRYFDTDTFTLTLDPKPPFDPLRFCILILFAAIGFGMIYAMAGCDHVWAANARLPGEDASDRLEAAGTLLRIIDTGLFKWGARLFAGVCIMSSAWALKEQRFGFAVICVIGALLFGTAPKWVKNIFDIGDNQGLFTRYVPNSTQRSIATTELREANGPAISARSANKVPITLVLQGRFPGWSRKKVDQLARHIAEECLTNQIDPALVLAVIHVESRFRTDAISNKGAQGLMQLMPGTARFVAGMMNRSAPIADQLYNPFTNTRLGIAYLAWLKNRYGGDLHQTLGAYNSGPGRVDRHISRYGKYASQVTRSYIDLVLEKQTHFRSLGVEFAGQEASSAPAVSEGPRKEKA